MEPVPGKDDSVYDFLYIDAPRLSHFLSQFNQYGSLTGLTRAVSESSSTSGGLNVVAAKVDTGSSQQTTQTRQFDPQWIAPLSFLDEANRRGMIVRDLQNARIGQLVLVSGDLTLFDLALIKTFWDIEPLKALLLRALAQSTADEPVASRQDRRRQDRDKGRRGDGLSPEAVGIEILKSLPHATLAAIQHDGHNIWTTLKEDSLVVSASDLLLKHGARISGRWNMIGILDAMPDSGADDTSALLADLMVPLSLGSLGEVVGRLAPAIRGMLGRPPDAHGMTPLLVFREVST